MTHNSTVGKSLTDVVTLINEKNLKNHYKEALFQARRQFFGKQNTSIRKAGSKNASFVMPQIDTKSSFLVEADEKTASAKIRESTIIAVLIRFFGVLLLPVVYWHLEP